MVGYREDGDAGSKPARPFIFENIGEIERKKLTIKDIKVAIKAGMSFIRYYGQANGADLSLDCCSHLDGYVDGMKAVLDFINKNDES